MSMAVLTILISKEAYSKSCTIFLGDIFFYLAIFSIFLFLLRNVIVNDTKGFFLGFTTSWNNTTFR